MHVVQELPLISILPTKKYVDINLSKSKKIQICFSPRWMQFKMCLVQKCLVEFKKLWKQKEEKYNQKAVISWLHLVGRIFLNPFELFQVILFAVNITAIPVKGASNSNT